MTTDTWLTQLQDNGYRLTEARRAVVDAIQKSKQALTPVQVFDLARKTSAFAALSSMR